MAQLLNRIVYLGIFLIFQTGLGSAVRIVINPDGCSELSDKINITCVPDGPRYTSKSIMNMQIMKSNEPTMAVIDNTQKLRMGTGSHDNMKAEGHVDTTEASKSRLTLIIEKPGRQDSGIYMCKVFFTDETFNVVEDSVYGKVKVQSAITTPATKRTGCPDGWRLYTGDNTCLKYVKDNFHTWSAARKTCQSFGGDLVIIRDQEKNNFVFSEMVAGNWDTWIGVKNQGSRGYDFRYVDGSDLCSHHPWKTGEPDGDDGYNRKCVGMSYHKVYNGQWWDWDCNHVHPYVCSI